MIPIQTDWKGHYLDGRTAARRSASIQLMRLGLHIAIESGETLWWPYEDIRQSQGFYAGEQVRLERGGDFPEVLLIPDAAFLTHLHQMAPGLATKFHNPASRKMRTSLVAIAAVTSIALLAALYLWGIPALAAFAAPRVPVSWEEHLGSSVIEYMAPPEKQCNDPSLARAVNEIVKALTDRMAESTYTFRVFVVDNPAVNAFAAPGGYVVLFSGLVEQAGTPEELAGVLAHELQHVLLRHATRALIQDVSTGLLLAALTGDASGAANYGLEGARTLGLLHYSRRNEEEADAAGMRMILDAGISPKGMIRFFEKLKKSGSEAPSVFAYLSTHPTNEDRIQKLQSLARGTQRKPVKLLPNLDWNDVKKICKAKE